MTTVSSVLLPETVRIHEQLDYAVNDLISSLPRIEQLTAVEQRGIIARYGAVLEGNFIYWMTGAYLSVKSEEARSIILENLYEEVRDCHPHMLRKFLVAAKSVPSDSDALAVYEELLSVRLFIGRFPRVGTVAMMAFFEGFIQRFMPYLAELARLQGSTEQQYTDVHGLCDVTHTQELYRAMEAEILLCNGSFQDIDLFAGVQLLLTLITKIVSG